MPAELLRDHNWPRDANVFRCFVHIYDHIDAHSSSPRPDPHESLFVALSDKQVKLVRKPRFLSLPECVAFDPVALLPEVRDDSFCQRSSAHLISDLKQINSVY